MKTGHSKSGHAATRKLRRRDFVHHTTAGVALLSAAPDLLGARGTESKLSFGIIGLGGRGSSHLRQILNFRRDHNVELVAVCDIYQPRLEKSLADCKSYGSAATGYHDYRKLLERKDLDCVIIATPDHWHARMCIDAINAGKDVYCEKPWTRYAGEAREVYHLVKQKKRILQVGTQHTADGRYWAARDAIRAGTIGKRVWSQVSYSRNSRGGEWNYPMDADASPANLDWEAFLGSTSKKPFNREHFFRFRKYWEYSGGIATDLHYHKLAPILLALGDDFPWRVTSGGGIWVHKDEGHESPRQVPDTFMTLIDMYGEHSVVLASSMANSRGLHDEIRGHEANISFVGGGIQITPEAVYAGSFKEKHGGAGRLRVPAVPRDQHMVNFIRCVRSRKEADLNCGPDLGYRTMVCIAMSVKAYRENKVLFWDKEKEQVTEKDPLAES